MQPELIIVGGPNGCGKTTFVKSELSDTGYPYLGADAIAERISPFDVAAASIEAGRQFLEQIDIHIEQRLSVIIETTLSGMGTRRIIKRAKLNEFRITTMFFYVGSPEMCVARVAQRVRRGGHHVPTEDVMRRYGRSLNNFWNIYRPESDGWVLSFSSESGNQCVAIGSGVKSEVRNSPLFRNFLTLVGVFDK